MRALQKNISDYVYYRGGSFEELHNETGIKINILEKIYHGCKHGKYRKSNLDTLYDFFSIKRDAWYFSNVKKWFKPTESVLGEIFRKKRIQLGLDPIQVESETHIDSRQLLRIEAGDSLPSFSSYTMTQLLSLYNFTEEEREKIRWFITILRDMVSINNSME